MVVDIDVGSHLCLPNFATVKARRRIEDKTYVNDWIFFNEADQLPHLQDLNWLLSLAQNENTILLPHRGIPSGMSDDFANSMNVAKQHDKARHFLDSVKSRTVHIVSDIRTKSCCFSSNALILKSPSEIGPNDTSMVSMYEH